MGNKDNIVCRRGGVAIIGRLFVINPVERTNMESQEFQIEFTYQDNGYVGLVTPIRKNKEQWYTIDLESENQESQARITARPSDSELEDWAFECGDGEPATGYYDKDLLQEVGEAIEKYLLRGSDTDRVDLE
jgi:hypothetical protein